MKMGFALQEITPQKSMLLAGYDCTRWSKSIHDPLYCRVILMEDNNKITCFVNFDVLCVGNKFIERIQEVSQNYGIQKENIIIGATHTHSGPKGLCWVRGLEGIFGMYDREYMEYCISVFEQSLKHALLALDDFTIKISTQKIESICSERHSTSFPYDNVLWKIIFKRNDGKNILLYNFSCHPTILNAENLSISADLPGYINQLYKKEFAMIMFYNGSAGDISTRFTRNASDFNEIERLGRKLYNQMMHNGEQIMYQGVVNEFNKFDKKIELKVWDKSHIDSFERYSQETNTEEAIKNNEVVKSLQYLQGQTFTLSFSIIQLNQCVIITIPSEITSSLTMPLTKKYPCMIFSYTSGYHMYLPSITAFENNYYEAAVCMLAKGEGERLIQYIENCLEDINVS